LIAILLAAPLGIVFSRRGVLSGFAGAIFSFTGMVFISFLMLALGKGARISPVVAAWGPLVVFACIGIYLLYLRSTNREAPWFSRVFGFQ
jgi:lipopolysaccharide export LptBFGC system permease protein LptF